jgi:hypothetical protein
MKTAAWFPYSLLVVFVLLVAWRMASHARRARLAPTPGPESMAAGAADAIIITDIRIGFGRMVELWLLLIFSAIPAAIIAGIFGGAAYLLVRALAGSP